MPFLVPRQFSFLATEKANVETFILSSMHRIPQLRQHAHAGSLASVVLLVSFVAEGNEGNAAFVLDVLHSLQQLQEASV